MEVEVVERLLMMRKSWSRWLSVLIAGIVSLGLGILSSHSSTQSVSPPSGSMPEKAVYTWDLPEWVPRPVIPADNPMSSIKVELGRHLFYERRLSITEEVSCGSCHQQALAFSDGKAVGVGATGERHPRNSMSLTNVAYAPTLTWANPLQTRLETQALVPLFGEHPIEMGMVGCEDQILAMLQRDPWYSQQFPLAFPHDRDPFTIANLTKAIAAFERILISVNSPYDHYRYGGDPQAISAAAKRGEALFHSERLECFHCHGGFNFTDSIMHERLAFQEIAFHNTGLYNLDPSGRYPYPNTGVYEITHDPADMGRFKAPSLRNIALTAPYMHDGSIATLEDVMDHYAAGGRTIHSGPYAGIGSQNPLKSNFVKGFDLTPSEKTDLIAFLKSLTDEQFITHKAFSDPAEQQD